MRPEYNETINIGLVEYDDILRNDHLYKPYFVRSLRDMEHAIKDLSSRILRERAHSGGFVFQQYQDKNSLCKCKYEKYSQKSNNIIDLISIYKNITKKI